MAILRQFGISPDVDDSKLAEGNVTDNNSTLLVPGMSNLTAKYYSPTV